MLLIGHATWEIYFNQSEALTRSGQWRIYQYGISALVSQTSFGGETRGSVAKCRLFSQANSLYNKLDSDSSPDHLQSSTSPLPLSHCSCSAGCSTKRCSCVRENIKCQDCRCGAPCKNPLNIMAEFGVDVDKATSDICLMQKLPKVCSMSRPPYQTCDCLLPLVWNWNSCIARITFIEIQLVDVFFGTICTTFFLAQWNVRHNSKMQFWEGRALFIKRFILFY